MLLPKPWFRKSKKAWYLQVARGQQLCLGKTKAEADRRYREWLIENTGAVPRSDLQVAARSMNLYVFSLHCSIRAVTTNARPMTRYMVVDARFDPHDDRFCFNF